MSTVLVVLGLLGYSVAHMMITAALSPLVLTSLLDLIDDSHIIRAQRRKEPA